MKLQPLVDVLLGLSNDKIPMNIDLYSDVVWTTCSNYGFDVLEVNTDNSVDDLWGGNGNTYRFEYESREDSEDGYVLFYNATNGCGDLSTLIFKASEEV